MDNLKQTNVFATAGIDHRVKLWSIEGELKGINLMKEIPVNGIVTDLKIREDCIGRKPDDIYVMGRSIGSGGASYLAGHRSVPVLILISPFDTIKDVARDMVGCLGCLIKQHFDNLTEIKKFNGKLLVIHGERDDVIGVSHVMHSPAAPSIGSFRGFVRSLCYGEMPRAVFAAKIDLLLHECGEGLDIGAESSKSEDDVVLEAEDSLKIIGDGEHLFAEASVAGNTDAIFADHADECSSVVFVD
ncbi:unnamed protein product [Sphagnum balticum]